MRKSKSAEMIISLLENKGALSAKEISTHLNSFDRVTIYRSINKLLSEGLIREVNLEKSFHSYELSSLPHLHTKCVKCGKVGHIDMPKKLIEEIAKYSKNFNIHDIEITVNGECKD